MMISLPDQTRILSGILTTPFFIFSSFTVLVGYVVMWFRKRQTLTNAISIFEVPLIMSCLAVLASLFHLALRALFLSSGIDGAIGVPLHVLTAIFYVSTGMLTVANNLLLPLLFTYSIGFFAKNTHFRLLMFITAILYTNTKYLIFLRILPNFIQYNFTSAIDISKCLVLNPIDSAMLVITLILIFCKLQLTSDKIGFENAVIICEVLCVALLRIIWTISDIIAVRLHKVYIEYSLFISGLNTETMLMKNYEYTQMLIPYLFLICTFLVKLDGLRRRAAVSIVQAREAGNTRCSGRKAINGARSTVAEAPNTQDVKRNPSIAEMDPGSRRPPYEDEQQQVEK